MLTLPSIPANSILGLNYSGQHDSAIAIVSPDGEPLFALSLERITRIKQDGRPPYALLEFIPFKQIASVSVSTESAFSLPERWESQILDNRLPFPREDGLRHTQPFYDFLESIPCQKEFICHELAHAASAFWLSDFHQSLCLTYDGGMFNSPWFGGVYSADREKGIHVLDQFSALHYSKVTTLYTFITALLGFTPNKHEGKITGLAAYGHSNASSRKLIHHWFYDRFLEIESVMDWVFPYDYHLPALLLVDESKMDIFQQESSCFTREELAATVQEFAEDHILNLLRKIKALGWDSENICLAGGLFANVKINHRVLDIGFKNLFVAPPMTDDGTALGAALQTVWINHKPEFKSHCSMFLGPCYTKQALQTTLREEDIQYQELSAPEEKIATLLAEGAVIGVFQGNMEFGPRALGHRSILSQATKQNINSILNARLGRTEFMPFAPITREEDAFFCYQNIESVRQAIDFMTVTVNCTEEMLRCCPAVVHIDGTARPQIVHKGTSPFIHSVLTHYKTITGIPALINTSFNIHEEPIVCSPHDALRGFFGARLDYLYFEGGFLISYQENKEAALRYLYEEQPRQRLKTKQWSAILRLRNELFRKSTEDLTAKELEIRRLDKALSELRRSGDRIQQGLQEQSSAKENEISRLHRALIETQDQNETKEAELLRLSMTLSNLRAQLEAKESEIIRLDKELTELRIQNNAKEEEIKLLDTALTELRETNQDTILNLKEKLEEKESQAFQEFREASERERQSLRIQLQEKDDLSEKLRQEEKRFQLEFQSRLQANEEIILDQRHALNAYYLLSKLEEKEPLLEQIQRTNTQENNHLQTQLEEKENVIIELSRALEAYRSAFNILGRIASPWRSISSKLRSLVQPRIGNLYQHPPKDIALPSFYRKPVRLTTSPKISMVTPSYGQADFIERTLKSVLDQKYPNLEYFIQDGGSKDGTKEILTRYSMQLSGWESAPDNGQSHAINLGFQKTTGEIMAWLNSDDVLLPGALTYIADYFNRHPKVDVIYGHRLLIDENDKLIGRWMLPAHDNKALSWADFIPQETLFWRRRIWEKIGGKVDQSFQFAIDWDLLVRFREAGAVFARLPRFLGGFRVHSQQKTSATITDLGFQEMNRIRQRIHGYLPSSLEIRKALIAYTGKHLLVDVIWRIRRLLGFPS